LLGFSFFSDLGVFAQADQITLKLQLAESAVGQAFDAVLDAEKTGANVTDHLAQLNMVENILALAEISYRTGDFNAASSQADRVFPIAKGVTISAQDVKQTALVSSKNTYWFTNAITATGLFAFVLLMLLFWRRFKHRYIDRLSEATPEVNNQ
jgi:hypothetical protein